MQFKSDYACIPEGCRDQHLPMVPRYAAPFKKHGVRGAGIHEVVEPYEIRRVSAPWHIVLVTVAGEAEYECKSERGTIRANDIWVGPADFPYAYRARGEWKFMSAALFRTDRFAHLEGKVTCRSVLQTPEHLLAAMEAYLFESSLRPNVDAAACSALAEYISVSLARQLMPAQPYESSRARLDLHRLWESVNATPSVQWRLADLARQLGVSIRQFQRMMREHYDLTSEQMLLRIRMEHARELLAATDLSMEMISEQVGYQSVYSFAKAFKRHFGEPPGAHRKRLALSQQMTPTSGSSTS